MKILTKPTKAITTFNIGKKVIQISWAKSWCWADFNVNGMKQTYFIAWLKKESQTKVLHKFILSKLAIIIGENKDGYDK